MPNLRTIMNLALGYPAHAEGRTGPRYRMPTAMLAYGAHPLQTLDFHAVPDVDTRPRPLLVFVHGGAWQYGDKVRRIQDFKAAFAHGEGWHFASLNFRLVPEVGAAEMARDVAAGLAMLAAQAGALGVDRSRIAVMGHSSGAHLAALAASDAALLGAHGLAPAMLAGVIANDGAAYDPLLPSTGSRILARLLVDPAFAGADLAAVSPVAQIAGGAGALPPFLILSRRGHGQSALLARALAARGAAAEWHQFAAFGPLGHVRLSRRFGRAGYGPTEAAREWLRGAVRVKKKNNPSTSSG